MGVSLLERGMREDDTKIIGKGYPTCTHDAMTLGPRARTHEERGQVKDKVGGMVERKLLATPMDGLRDVPLTWNGIHAQNEDRAQCMNTSFGHH